MQRQKITGDFNSTVGEVLSSLTVSPTNEPEPAKQLDKLDYWYAKTGLTPEFSFANDAYPDSKLSKIAHRYLETLDETMTQGYGLLLSGVKGCGKTYTSACIGRELVLRGYTVQLVTAPRLVQLVQANNFTADCLDKYQVCQFLILDDVGAERVTDFAQEIVYEVVDKRYTGRKPIIASTNLSIRELKNPDSLMQGRTFDRLLERCYPYVCEKINRRAHFSCYNQMKRLLEE